jgi:hypothetical protein
MSKKWRFPAVFAIVPEVAGGRKAPPASLRKSQLAKGEGRALYKVGDKVVYPHHGAGTVVKKESREVLGEKREYLTIKILHNS